MRTGTKPLDPFESGIDASPITSKDGASIFSIRKENLNTCASIIWSEYASRELLGQKVWKNSQDRFSRNMPSTPKKRVFTDKKSRFEYIVQDHHRDPKRNPEIHKALKPKPFKSLPHGAARVPTATEFHSNYNVGCYQQYEKIKNPDLPAGHIECRAEQLTPINEPGGGSIVSIRGVSELAPSRFCRKNASKSWVDYLSQSRSNNRFQTLQSEMQEMYPETPQRWNIKYNGRHGARKVMEKAEYERAQKRLDQQSYSKPPCGIKIHSLESIRARHQERQVRSQTADPQLGGQRAAAKARAEIELKEKQLAQLAHQEAELDRREEQLRSQIY